ncbi:50S ribosomal protein L31 [Buchnera aphidicola str. APS (Acyrthosiphon pisum)]|uniref:Large ribosomal subunit protein bL31 n=2 Tax=Buchnera aphidicola TaxID=9 RepID=RL31_BUCAI|nr:50S ribosomal protein L31 [Buchnera aphidicola]B8D8E0.1 RecName: Full=Large ribosomal subunit protein bL31; AltName: Full=50S ribosomal protein L31 [Buchnera aphidicola str. 5A (Acyrthosiphon pisum)]P57639.1 RecName: Full=Large ribosomal subunit protein bL31; AltName: Full=50S ribosomal protein L31 [Buchnera aphidicola str. APS (Acyrthosiphon pisum)]pir/B84997/ 50S ribosomal protein L31 [imported] - Buchnera sp. (strain APS) [Buchnera sp. (in: enterobacteria)]OQX98356.1 MAG: 50S ribosomal pr
MKKKIHPRYSKITATCSCGNIIEIFSTINHNLNLDICAKCHPFYTGKQRVIDTGGRVERFKKRFKFTKQELN